MVIYGERIRALREERGYSLADFAQKAGISVSYLSEIERGAKKPSLQTMERIARALNVSKAELVQLSYSSKGLNLGERLRLLRQDRGLTLAEAAEEAGISPSYLSEIERGAVYPSTQTLKRLADSLGVPVSALVGEGGLLGAKLREAREQQGLTQAELAREAGVSPGLIGQIEHGRVQPSLETVEKIAKVLGVSPCYFILDDADVENMLRFMGPDLRALLAEPKVQAVLRLICNCTEEELRFILEFIKLYKRSGATHAASNGP